MPPEQVSSPRTPRWLPRGKHVLSLSRSGLRRMLEAAFLSTRTSGQPDGIAGIGPLVHIRMRFSLSRAGGKTDAISY